VEEVNKFANKGISKVLIGNKTDLTSERKITTQDGEALAKHFGMKFLETSAKDSSNVTEAFKLIVQEIINPNKRRKILDETDTKKCTKLIGYIIIKNRKRNIIKCR